MSLADELLAESIENARFYYEPQGHGIFIDIMRSWPTIVDDIWSAIVKVLGQIASAGMSKATVDIGSSPATGEPGRNIAWSADGEMARVSVQNWLLYPGPFPVYALGNIEKPGMREFRNHVSDELEKRFAASDLKYHRYYSSTSFATFDVSWLSADKKKTLVSAMNSPSAAAAIRAGVPISDVIA